MSKLGNLGKFLHIVGTFAPLILAVTPLAPIAGAVTAAIQEAESIAGATGAEKLARVTAIAVDAAHAANAQAGHVVVDPVAVQTEAATVISAVIQATNLAKPHAA